MNALFDQICAIPTLLLGFDRVEENAGGPGVDGVCIEDVACQLDDTMRALRTDLVHGTYLPLPLLRIHMDKGDGKTRPLSIPTVRDRIVQTAAAIVLTPVLEKEFETCSYAYRKGRSVQQAIRQIISYREQGYQWVVDADIQSFFDEIDHARLLLELETVVPEVPILDLVKKWLTVDVVEGDHRWRLTKGVPQGSPISPVLSNLYLDHFDEALLKARHKLVRFADDFVILCKDQPRAKEALELTQEVLQGLGLSLHPAKTHIVDFNRGFRYLGVQFIRSLAFRPEFPEAPFQRPERGSSIFQEPLSALQQRKASSNRKSSSQPVQNASTARASQGLEIPATTMGRAFASALQEVQGEEAEEVWEGLLPEGEKTALEEPSSGSAPSLRTLYLVEQGSVLAKSDERFVVSKGGVTLREIPAIKVDQIMVFGNIHITTPAMRFCLMDRIPIFLLSSRGRYFGTLESNSTDQVVLHRDQFASAGNPDFCLNLAKSMVRGKVGNAKVLLQRYARHRPRVNLSACVKGLTAILHRLPGAQSLDEVRGYEGAAAAQYFGGMRLLIGEPWGFVKRQKQPPPDPVNSLLSLGYTLLFYNAYALVRAHGLHPAVGYLHPLHQGHPALVSDLIEEFRAPVVDAVVLNLVLHERITPGDFIGPTSPGLPCLLNDQARKVFIRAFEDKMNSRVTHPATGYHVDYRRCLDLQVQQLARCIRQPGHTYQPMSIR